MTTLPSSSSSPSSPSSSSSSSSRERIHPTCKSTRATMVARVSTTSIFALIFMLQLQDLYAFAPRNRWRTPSMAITRPTARFYKSGNNNNDNNNNDSNNKDDNNKNNAAATTAMTIPVLGPIPNQGPLLLGAEMTLHPPTPWQWHTIQEAVWQHAQAQGQTDCGTIDAAPLVAIMDHATHTSTEQNKNPRARGRYATLAACVGVNTAATFAQQQQQKEQQQLDLTDNTSFSESLRHVTRTTVTAAEGKIRLVGVGRARLTDFFYRVPSTDMMTVGHDDSHIEKVRTSGMVENSMRSSAGYDQQDTNEMAKDNHDGEDVDEDRVNLVMAHFRILTDRNERDGTNEFSVSSSPVHALAEMGNWARKMDFLHADRRKLVAGLQAAAARLTLNQQQVDHSYFDDFSEDYDGLGMLTASRYDMSLHEEREASQPAVDNILQIPPASHLIAEHDTASPLLGMENYGMGYSSSSFSTLPQVTSVWLDKLQPYYSPELRATEEYYYEVMSFVAILSMDKYLTDNDVGWALTCCNTVERMQQAYDWLFSHIRLLKDEAAQMSAKLRECGEECTDLW